jgi:hypothetical protein
MNLSSALGPVDRVALCALWLLYEGLEGGDDAVGEVTGDRSCEGVEAISTGIDCSEGVSGSSPEFDVSSWDPDGGGDRGGKSGFASIEAGRYNSGVPL